MGIKTFPIGDKGDCLPNVNSNQKIYIGIAGDAVTPTLGKWVSWSKPDNITMVHILCLGGGGGGGSGRCGLDTSSPTGGSGGGSSSVANFLYPAEYLPNTLYVSVGAGGMPGASVVGSVGNAGVGNGNPGGSGGISYVAVSASPGVTPNASALLAVSSTAGAGPGVGGTTAARSGGAAGTIPTVASAPFSSFALRNSKAGQVGGGSVTGVNTPTDVNSINQFVTGGAAGDSYSSTSGTFSYASNVLNSNVLSYPYRNYLPYSSAGGSSQGFLLDATGHDGVWSWNPMRGYGGGGGGTYNIVNSLYFGAPGGDGAFGCGGGGGAFGQSTSGGPYGSSGVGGAGGPGLVIVSAW